MGRSRPWLVLGLLPLACGYGFSAGGPALAGGVRPVYVPTVANRTSEAGLEVTFTEALREQLGRVGVLGGVSSPARMEGEILAVSAGAAVLSPSSAPRPNQALSYRVHVVLRVKLYKGSELVTQVDVSGDEDYLQGQRPDILSVESNRVAALKRLAAVLAQDAYTRLAAG
ncbi:MAG TPA: LPS assembly lipoprotein LptE [Myxococcaceae bacterium]|nr:LPS assembly lipoprotein LptE [Myxococcaceae bacterium]